MPRGYQFWLPNFWLPNLVLYQTVHICDEVIHKAWWGIGEVPYCFSRSFVKFWGHMGQKIADFHPNLVFPDCNSSLNWPMAMIWCTKLGVALKRCLIVLQGHLSNFKVTRDKKESPILTWIWCFRTVSLNWLMAIKWWWCTKLEVA